jgi:cytoskeletal protein RodZ
MTPPASSVAGRRAAGQPARPKIDRRPPLRVVETEPRRRAVARRSRRLAPLVSVAMVVASLLAVVVGHSYLDQGQVRLAAVESALTSAQTTQSQDVLTVAKLETPSRVVSEAEAHGLAQATQIMQVPHVPLNVAIPAPKMATPSATATPGPTAAATTTPAPTAAATTTPAPTAATATTPAPTAATTTKPAPTAATATTPAPTTSATTAQ